MSVKVWRPSSFTYLNLTQFLAALNDNIFKLLVVYFFIQVEGTENSHRILATTGAIFVLPFLLFSASSGTMADRFSKRNIIVFTKTLEFVTLALGVLAFQYESKVGSYCVLFLMATLSAIFGPSKYGILPELVSTDKISKANGLMTSFTFLAIILGTFGASFILDITNRHFIFAALFSALMAFIAMSASFFIEYTP
ncbi:MAG: MFS transporter, partial [Parachlamydiaceae bacterium]